MKMIESIIYAKQVESRQNFFDFEQMATNDFDFFENSPSLNLTLRQHEPPIFSSTPLVTAGKASTTPQSSIFLPLSETGQFSTKPSENLLKLNEVRTNGLFS